MKRRSDVVRKRREGGGCPFTIYDLRFTIYDLRFEKFARLRRGEAEQGRAECDEAVRGRSYKGAEAPGGAYVRCTTYDVRFGK